MSASELGLEDRGRYFGGGEHCLTIPIEEQATDWTLVGWFIWISGNGPLIATSEEEWASGWPYDRDGLCAYRIGASTRITNVSVEPLRDHWNFVAVAKSGHDATLWINDAAVDTWYAAPDVALTDLVVLKYAEGYVADLAYVNRRLPNDALSTLWAAGQTSALS